MADDKVNVPKGILQRLLTEQDVLAKCVEGILNQVLEAQMSEHLKATPYERQAFVRALTEMVIQEAFTPRSESHCPGFAVAAFPVPP